MLNLLEKFSASITLGNLKVRPSNRDWIVSKARLKGMCLKQFVRWCTEEQQRIDEANETKSRDRLHSEKDGN